MKISQAFPSRFLKNVDLDGKSQTFIMSHVKLEEMGHGQAKESRPVLYFEGSDRGLVLNKVNGNTIADAYGDDSDGWEGKPIVLFPATAEFSGKSHDVIRVRTPKPGETVRPIKQQVDVDIDDDLAF